MYFAHPLTWCGNFFISKLHLRTNTFSRITTFWWVDYSVQRCQCCSSISLPLFGPEHPSLPEACRSNGPSDRIEMRLLILKSRKKLGGMKLPESQPSLITWQQQKISCKDPIQLQQAWCAYFLLNVES